MDSRPNPILWGLSTASLLAALILVINEKNEIATGFLLLALVLQIIHQVARRPVESERSTPEEVAEKLKSKMDDNFYPGVMTPGKATEPPGDEIESHRDTDQKKFRRKTERVHRALPDQVSTRKPPVTRQQRGMR